MECGGKNLQKATMAWSPPQVILQNSQNFTWERVWRKDLGIILEKALSKVN